jgi:hypothetical protein
MCTALRTIPIIHQKEETQDIPLLTRCDRPITERSWVKWNQSLVSFQRYYYRTSFAYRRCPNEKGRKIFVLIRFMGKAIVEYRSFPFQSIQRWYNKNTPICITIGDCNRKRFTGRAALLRPNGVANTSKSLCDIQSGTSNLPNIAIKDIYLYCEDSLVRSRRTCLGLASQTYLIFFVMHKTICVVFFL